MRVNVSLEMDFCGSANFSYCTTLTNVNGQSASRYATPVQTTPDSISPGPMKSFLGESVVTSRHDVTPQKGGFSIVSNRTGKSEAGETYYIIYSLPSPSPSNDTFVVGSSGR